ncbi:hypothetical protein AWR36_011455 [Microbulbifer flavimaris]|uniref:DUF2946 domain-containing protein n=1 Tax=Microbulbifer flavimaris TaxID=1781068 RepID=A0ABX4I048_9GAMM|nr:MULTISPECIES: hypothetical protein [Microbulbifer]KUJ83139.1 hypothetical protein AVO43_11430 [Microbulbifer sp. ZGT114]PCO05327.1 hypothetical protein AWR36_011455 [Microbulbifer flavimaris]
MHRILTLFLLLMFSAQSFASAVQHDCGEMDMGSAGSMAHADMDMHHDMSSDMPCCDDSSNDASASEQARQCQLSCALGTCASPVAVVAVFSPLEVTRYHPTVTWSPIERPDTPHSSLFRPPIAA